MKVCAGKFPGGNAAQGFQRGLSLIELMVSLALSVALIAMVLSVFVGMRRTDRVQESEAVMQDAGRFAMTFLAKDIRMAGYLGCSSSLEAGEINNTLDSPPPSFQPGQVIQGWEADGTAPGDISNSVDDQAVTDTGTGGWQGSGGNVLYDSDVLPGTDVIRVWGGDDSTEGVIQSITQGANTVVNVSYVDIADDEILLLSDCTHADWVQACTVQQVGNPVTLNLVLSSGCSPGNDTSAGLTVSAGGRVMRLGGTMYYIGKRDNDAANPPVLMRRRLNNSGVPGTPEELVEGIENMQVLYGENTDSDNHNSADRFVPADQVGDWSKVVSLRISLLVQSLGDNYVQTPSAYSYNGVTYDGVAGNGSLPPDGRLRRIYTGTISIRNRTLGG